MASKTVDILKTRKDEDRVQIFQKNLQHFLEKLGLSGKKLAAKIKVDQRTISRYVNEGGNPKPETLLKLAKEFGCSAEDLWTYDFSNPDPDHRRQYTRKPNTSDKEFSYFEGMRYYLYYLREGTSTDVYEGILRLDDQFDVDRLFLHGHASTGHEYDVKLVIEDHDSVFLYGVGDEDERRFYIALHYPDFRDDEDYTKGVGVLTRLDAQKCIVAQRVVLSYDKIDLADEGVKAHLIKLLSHSDKVPRVWVNTRVDNEFRTGKWLD